MGLENHDQTLLYAKNKQIDPAERKLACQGKARIPFPDVLVFFLQGMVCAEDGDRGGLAASYGTQGSGYERSLDRLAEICSVGKPREGDRNKGQATGYFWLGTGQQSPFYFSPLSLGASCNPAG